MNIPKASELLKMENKKAANLSMGKKIKSVSEDKNAKKNEQA